MAGLVLATFNVILILNCWTHRYDIIAYQQNGFKLAFCRVFQSPLLVLLSVLLQLCTQQSCAMSEI